MGGTIIWNIPEFIDIKANGSMEKLKISPLKPLTANSISSELYKNYFFPTHL